MSIDVVLLGLAATVDPLMMAVVLVLLSRRHPHRGLGAYLAGGFAASTAVGMALVFGLGRIGLGGLTDLPAGLRLALGLILLGAGAVIWRRNVARRRTGAGLPPAPEWVHRLLDRSGAPLAFAVGAVANLPGGYTLLAFASVADGDPGFAAALAQILLFNAIMFLPAEIPFAVSVLRPRRTGQVVEGLRRFMERRGPVLAASVTVLLGGAFTISGLGDLA